MKDSIHRFSSCLALAGTLSLASLTAAPRTERAPEQGQEPRWQTRACCTITAIDSAKGFVKAKETASNHELRFAIPDHRLLASLRIGVQVYADYQAKQVSLDGKKACCKILSDPSAGVTPRPQMTSRSPSTGVSVPVVIVPPGGIPVPPNPDIEGGGQPRQYVAENRSSPIKAVFSNVGKTLPADGSAPDPQPAWYVDGQIRQPAPRDLPTTLATTGVPHGRPAWPTYGTRTYTINLTLPAGQHEVKAVMPPLPGEQNLDNNTAIIPVSAGQAELVAHYDDEFINNGDLNESYSRFRFWAENTGAIASQPCRIRLTFYYRLVVYPPYDQEAVDWTKYGSVFDDIPSIIRAGKSEYIFTQIWFQAQINTGDVLPAFQYKWEFTVDENDAVIEDNKANNKLTVQKTDKGYDHFVMGKNHW
jgi:hypothetical protein